MIRTADAGRPEQLNSWEADFWWCLTAIAGVATHGLAFELVSIHRVFPGASDEPGTARTRRLECLLLPESRLSRLWPARQGQPDGPHALRCQQAAAAALSHLQGPLLRTQGDTAFWRPVARGKGRVAPGPHRRGGRRPQDGPPGC